MLRLNHPGRDDDRRFVLELGLLRETAQGTLEVANPIYRDIIGRTLSAAPRAAMPALEPTWLGADGQLDPARNLSAFLAFWR